MISCLGNEKGDNPGGFLLLDENFKVKGRWDDKKSPVNFFYDFCYKPRHNIMVSSEWAAPNVYVKGFNPADVAQDKYGHHLHFWNWSERRHTKTVDLGTDGLIPLELRFCHDPENPSGYIVCALGGGVFRFYKDVNGNEWKTEKVIQVDAIKSATGDAIPPVISDMLISLDDRFIYFCNWLHGDVRQYFIGDETKPPKLTARVWIGGLPEKKNDFNQQHERPVNGGPQMIQLSLDGKRLYVTNSLFSSWDDQFYPDMKTEGSYLVKIDCQTTTDDGGMKLDDKFFINFKNEPHGPARAHEMRYPGGDCTSDIWN